MKKHNLLKVVLITLLLVVIGSWFLPVTVVTSEDGVTYAFSTKESIKIGLFNLASYIRIIFEEFGPIIFYALSVGGLYGVLYKIPQYRTLLDKIAEGFKGKEWIFMTIVGVVFALLSSMAGLSLMILLFFPFVISIILLMGYNRMTAVMLTVGSVIAGLIGTVFSASAVEGMSALFYNLSIEGYTDIAKYDALWKILLLVVSLAIVLVNTIMYAKNHKNNEVDLEKTYLVPKKVKEVKNIYPLVIVLDLLLVVMTLAYISWSLLDINLFSDITNAFINPNGNKFIKGLYGGINTVLGIGVDSNMGVNNTFGSWSSSYGCEAALVVLLTSGLLAFMYRVRFNDYLDALGKGVKKALKPTLFIVLAYLILICMASVPFEYTFLQHIINLNGGFNLFIMCIIAFVFCILSTDMYFGVMTAASYLYINQVYSGNTSIITLVWQSMYGLAMLIAPTSIILLATLAYVDESYTGWIKSVWKIFLELLAAIIIILFIANMVI